MEVQLQLTDFSTSLRKKVLSSAPHPQKLQAKVPAQGSMQASHKKACK
jgi:hypothetical protein